MLVVDKSTDRDKPHFDWFFTTISKKIFFQSASWKKHCATHCVSSVVWSLIDNGKLHTYMQPKQYCPQLRTCIHLLKFLLQDFLATLQPDCEISSNCGKNKVSRARATCNFWLVRSEHALASYPGLSFRPPWFSPYRGREERRVQGLDYALPSFLQSLLLYS